MMEQQSTIEIRRRIWNSSGFYTEIVPSDDCPGYTEIRQTDGEDRLGEDGLPRQKIVSRVLLSLDELRCMITALTARYPEAEEEDKQEQEQ